MGTKTLLDGVNDILMRMGSIKSNSGSLDSLVDSQRQVHIDLAIQAWNEVIIDLYDSSEDIMPNEMGITTITLALNDRDYVLPSNLTSIRWPLKNLTNGDEIFSYAGGYEQMFKDQSIPDDYTGKPQAGCIRPSDGYLYLDYIPTSAEHGAVYTLLYDKSLIVSESTDVFAFNDDVYFTLLQAVVEKMKMERDEQSDARYSVSQRKYDKAIARAAAKIRLRQPNKSWGPKRISSMQDFDMYEE